MKLAKINSRLLAIVVILVHVCASSVSAQTLTSFEKKGKYGFKDENGVVVIDAKYKYVKEFSEGLAAVQTKDKWGFIDKTGTMVLAAEFVDVASFSEGLAAVKKSFTSGTGYINSQGEEVLPFEFSSVSQFHGGNAMEGEMIDFKAKFGFIDKSGKVSLDPVYDQISYEDGLWKVKLDGKTGFLDLGLNIVLPVEYDVVESFSGGLAIVNIGGKYNSQWVLEGGKFGVIDKKGKLIVPVIYDSIKSFDAEGKAKVKLNGEEFSINKIGEKVN